MPKAMQREICFLTIRHYFVLISGVRGFSEHLRYGIPSSMIALLYFSAPETFFFSRSKYNRVQNLVPQWPNAQGTGLLSQDVEPYLGILC